MQGAELALHTTDGKLQRFWKLEGNGTALKLLEVGAMKGRVIVAVAGGALVAADVNDDVLQPLLVHDTTIM